MTAVFKHGDLIQKLLNDTDASQEVESVPDRCFIYRVPECIRTGNEELHTPVLISIGPLHHNKQKLAVMENKKKQYVKSFLQRTTFQRIDHILSFIKDNEKTIRACYAEASTLGSSEFVMMILYDSIFIIELFLIEKLQDRCDISADKISLCRDLLLLENQLPHFVLQGIYKLAVDGSDINFPFMELSRNFFARSTSVEQSGVFSDFTRVESSTFSAESVKHFTDWKRIILLKGYLTFQVLSDRIDNLPCAVKLYASGVKFKSITNAPYRSLFKVSFEKQKQLIPFFEVLELKIPHFLVDERTEHLLGNIIAMEKCLYPDKARVCNYVELMAYLMRTEEDVDLLVKKGIISNKMSNNASVANMFKKLNVLHGPSPYYGVCEELKKHYNNPWNRAKVNLKTGTLKRVYQLLRQ
ncbi:UPF0481 protein At3g47200-like [Mangifera indica]|uniref:UPF0481 protein At3g47200-like n=1 Tax=Mangifera indica TaxID=29780 RepID=UPI001CFAEE9A|nr:UPF0481 protein At3g47200-like [Mangifera indica]